MTDGDPPALVPDDKIIIQIEATDGTGIFIAKQVQRLVEDLRDPFTESKLVRGFKFRVTKS